MRIVAVLLCALASTLAPAQYQPGWSRVGDGPLAVTASQQIRFSGMTAIEAIDRNGNTLWSKPHVYDLYRKLVTAGEDTIHTSAPSGGQPAQVLCLDESGDERWSRIFPGVVAKMIPNGDHVYIICDQSALGRDLVVVTKLNRISGAEVWSEAAVALDNGGIESGHEALITGGHLFLAVTNHPNPNTFTAHLLRVSLQNGAVTSRGSYPAGLSQLGLTSDGGMMIYAGSRSSLAKFNGNQAPTMTPLWTRSKGSPYLTWAGDAVFSTWDRSFYKTSQGGVQTLLHQAENPEDGYNGTFTDTYGRVYVHRYHRNSEFATNGWGVSPYHGSSGLGAGVGGTGFFGGVVTDAYGTIFVNGGYGSLFSTFGEFYRAPEPKPDSYILNPGQTLTVDAPGLIENDFYVDPAKCTTMLLTSPSYGVATVSTDGSFTYQPSAGFVGRDTFTYRVTRGSVSGTGTVTLDVNAPIKLTLNKTQVAGQNWVLGTVGLDEPSIGPVPVSLGDNSTFTNTPGRVTIPAGQLSRNFAIQTMPVSVSTPVRITATFGTNSHTQTVTLIPLCPMAIVFTPSTVAGGATVSARIVINGVAGTGGFSLNLSSNSPHALVPSTVTVPEGQSSATFTFPTTSPATTTLAEITAHVLAGSKKAYLRINP